jgi:hypothetical protein
VIWPHDSSTKEGIAVGIEVGLEVGECVVAGTSHKATGLVKMQPLSFQKPSPNNCPQSSPGGKSFGSPLQVLQFLYVEEEPESQTKIPSVVRSFIPIHISDPNVDIM